ncbi:MAG: PIN domain-containing protein [Nanoarchaeota archaeon]|nr:PIN domain-containing protein [Nanoarchaeota archaeon]MBU1598065.1 PIN domain-containing protein [Nanoarchaeota archaeon]MBU2441643.1 PIN domain-containing protein [Nanoarchaeota archaeon]
MTKYYLDTCIWIDYFEDRKDNFRPLGDWAFRLIKKIITDENVIIISDLVWFELRKLYANDLLCGLKSTVSLSRLNHDA